MNIIELLVKERTAIEAKANAQTEVINRLIGRLERTPDPEQDRPVEACPSVVAEVNRMYPEAPAAKAKRQPKADGMGMLRQGSIVEKIMAKAGEAMGSWSAEWMASAVGVDAKRMPAHLCRLADMGLVSRLGRENGRLMWIKAGPKSVRLAKAPQAVKSTGAITAAKPSVKEKEYAALRASMGDLRPAEPVFSQEGRGEL